MKLQAALTIEQSLYLMMAYHLKLTKTLGIVNLVERLDDIIDLQPEKANNR